LIKSGKLDLFEVDIVAEGLLYFIFI